MKKFLYKISPVIFNFECIPDKYISTISKISSVWKFTKVLINLSIPLVLPTVC